MTFPQKSEETGRNEVSPENLIPIVGGEKEEIVTGRKGQSGANILRKSFWVEWQTLNEAEERGGTSKKGMPEDRALEKGFTAEKKQKKISE